MADPLKVLNSLDLLSDHYTVFEPDQVLTHGQLNSVTDYLDDQTRLSRVGLDGVGIVAGLHVALQAGEGGSSVRVGAGLGVTTDGDLMRLGVDTTFDRFRPYDATAPVYPPFWTAGDGESAPPSMLDLHELVPVGESDVLAQPLAGLPGGLFDKAVLMLMETVVNDPDLCSGTDCDNLGRDALHRVRFLLISRSDAQTLLDRGALAPASDRAELLPAVAMRRPSLGRDIGTTGVLAARFRDSANATLKELSGALPSLFANCPEVLLDMFGSDPTPGWQATLDRQASGFANATSGLQVWYDYVKDLVDHWNGLREALLADDAVLLPPVASFPKHLLLGALASPREQRTGLYPSPLDATCRVESAHARFLAGKLDVLIGSFALPGDVTTRITPSRDDAQPLEDRAIPWHYRVLEGMPIQTAWNFRLSSRHHEGHNLGYRAGSWATTPRARDPLAYAIGGNDFFRIEGLLGRQVEAVGDEIRQLIADRNLPFQVQEVLLHNDRKLIRKRPPIRYTPLHTLHYMLRQDVAFRIDESASFGSQYLGDVTSAVREGQVPGTTDSGASVVGIANTALQAIASVKATAAPVLSQPTYSAYQALVAGNGGAWKASYSTSLESVGNARANLGHVSRADFTSPYDSLIVNNQPHWIDWLDDLIQAGNDRADDKLLFATFVQNHPGIDHLGGVWRGGTFVLVYDDGGRVVADFTLPYPAAEDQTPEPSEPVLSKPPYRPPVAVTGGVRVLRPLDLKVQDSVLLQRQSFQFDLEKQTANIQGLVQGAFVPNNAVPAKTPRITGVGLTSDAYLNFSAQDMANRLDRVQQLRDLITQPGLPEETRTLIERDLTRAQTDLADTVAAVTTRVVTQQVDVASPTGQALAQQLAGSVAQIQDANAKFQLGTVLTGLAVNAGASHAALIGNLRLVGRIG